MKKYYFTWYNHIAQSEQTDFILANNMVEAKQIAVLIMQFFGGKRYGIEDIEVIDEISENYFYTMVDIKEGYEKCNKKFILPEIDDGDESDITWKN